MSEPAGPGHRRAVVRSERRGHVLVVTLDRPEARNAVTSDIARGLEAAIDDADGDTSIRCVVLTHTGPVFCAGADLRVVGAGRSDELRTDRGGFAGFVERQRSTPVIVAVDGPALAGGCEIVLAADLVVASTAASFGVPEVKRGLIAAAGGVFRLGRKLPMNVAMECVLTGDPLDAVRAERLGLVNVLTGPGDVLDAALALADRITANAPVAVQQSRRLVAEHTQGPEPAAWEATRVAWEIAMATDDVQEGVAAFVEKRAPRWTGR